MFDARREPIRSLAESIGHSLGTVAHLSRLRRDLAGGYSIDQANPWQTVESLKDKTPTAFATLLHSPDALLRITFLELIYLNTNV